MKIAIVVCYDQQDYVRANALRKGLQATKGVEIIEITNDSTGLTRYFETTWRILKARFTSKPDAYLITFRGYEMLLYMVLTIVRKPIIFDELVNFTEWMDEHRMIRQGTVPYKLFRKWYAWQARRCRVILADTDAHAKYSAELNDTSLDRYITIPVGNNEAVFGHDANAAPTKPFTVFYYGHMRPLHGLDYVLEAAVLLKGVPGIKFHFVGGGKRAEQACEDATAQGANIHYQKWVNFDHIPAIASTAGLTVGGPFGDTLQSQFVVTGKTYQFLSLGVPVLIGKNEVNEDFVDKRNCLMVPQANADAIAESIRWAYSHPEEMQRIAEQGHELYKQKFSQTEINKLVAKVVAQL